MNSNKTCLVLLLALSAFQLHAAPVLAVQSGSPEAVALLQAGNVDSNKVEDAQTTTDGLPTAPTAVATPVTDERMFSTVLPGHVVYLRAGSFTPTASWDSMTEQVSSAQPTGVVLDLRSNTTPNDLNGALRLASFIAQGQTGLVFHDASFVTAEVNQPHLETAPTVIVLIDRRTSGAAETLAAALQTRGALVMGQATAGRSPVAPDVTTPVDGREEAQALALIDRQQVGAVITEDANRHRMCEAALVRGQDPEQDTFITAHEAATPAPQGPVVQDAALVEALDSLKAIRVVQGEESSPSIRVADTASAAGQSVIASAEMGR